MDDQYNTRQTLIQRLKENHDEQSWEEFLRIYRPYILAVIRNMNIPEGDVDDIVQQVMIKLWKYIQTYSKDKRFRSWLSSVTANCVKDYLRKRMRDAERIKEASENERLHYLRSVDLPEVERIAEKEWGIYLTNLALERIEDLFAGQAIQVFLLSLEGVPVEEIARITQLKENSVYRLKNRVKKRLVLEIEQLREELE
ncbi:RNA polymerase sigma factor [Pontiellaceae bacterium B12227]|nr:RNA polymerase sigma factor [Pontiellaceae bacterium B12227]